MGNLVDAEARGTMDTLAEAGRPLRTWRQALMMKRWRFADAFSA